MPYLIITVAVLIVSPFVLRLAQNQKKEVKKNFKLTLLILLTAQVILGFLNWENFATGRSGFELSLTYSSSLLGFFFIISAIQITLIMLSKSFNTLVLVLNLLNTVLIFIGMIRLSNILGFQVISYAAVGAVFLVLIGNIITLAYINTDKNLLKK